ncbi:DUF4118 domain-containing protein, partial [Enterobacter hormaechei]|uniref:DUF4118 domain-containing protein n=1 Tax=Enterobacter hormaechei TaxID=158836 RepID=UPI001ADF0B89
MLDTDPDARPAPNGRDPVPAGDYGLALGAVLAASGIAWGAHLVLALPNISLVFLAAVLLVAVRSSLAPALVCAGLSFLAYDFLFIPPVFSLTIARQEDVLTLLFFFGWFISYFVELWLLGQLPLGWLRYPLGLVVMIGALVLAVPIASTLCR